MIKLPVVILNTNIDKCANWLIHSGTILWFYTIFALVLAQAEAIASVMPTIRGKMFQTEVISTAERTADHNETSGGIGGKIIRVTSLASKGPGSLREALETAGRRVIVFEVGGIIDLKGSVLRIREPFATIAGQTGPSPGITVIDGGIAVETHDVVIQHIRVRTGASRHKTGKWEPDAMVTVGAYNVLIDHCSITWGVDENCSASGPRFAGKRPTDWKKGTSHRVTISNNIIAEGLSNSTHSKGEHSKGTLVHDNATEIVISRNLYASNRDRNALFKGGTTALFLNNFIYNPGRAAVRYDLIDKEWQGYAHQKGNLAVIGNVLQLGPSSADVPLMQSGKGLCDIYLSDNIARNIDGSRATVFRGDRKRLNVSPPQWVRTFKVLSAEEVEKAIVNDVGARPWDRDMHDKRIISDVLTLRGKIIDSEDEVGGYPTFEPSYRKFQEGEWDMKLLIKKTSSTR